MQVNKTNKQPFTSKIVILSPLELTRITKKLKPENVINGWSVRTGFKTNMQHIYTRQVRSCTGGFVINNVKKTSPLAMHIEDTADNLLSLEKNADFIKDMYEGSNAFFIGGKTIIGVKYGNLKWKKTAVEIVSEFAEKVFDKLTGFAKEKDIPVTYFKNLDKYHEAHIYYNGDIDTVYCSIPSMREYMNYVKNWDELKSVVKEYNVAATDKLEFWG